MIYIDSFENIDSAFKLSKSECFHFQQLSTSFNINIHLERMRLAYHSKRYADNNILTLMRLVRWQHSESARLLD